MIRPGRPLKLLTSSLCQERCQSMRNNEIYEQHPQPNGRSADIGRRPDPQAPRLRRRRLWIWGVLLIVALGLILWKTLATNSREGDIHAVVNPQIGSRDPQPLPQTLKLDPPVENAAPDDAVPGNDLPDDAASGNPAPSPAATPPAPEASPEHGFIDEAVSEVPEAGDPGDAPLRKNGEVTDTGTASFPKGYSPFAPASMATTKFFNDHLDQFSEMEEIQVAREPGVVEFMIRLRFPEIAPRSDAWDGNLQLETEPRVGSGIPHFVQWDERWGYSEYAGGPLGETGCGPTCLAMAYAGLTGRTDYPPNKMAEFATERYHAIDDVGTAWSLFDTGIEELGLRSEHLSVELEAFQDALDDGKLILLSVKKGDFTSSGHFILLWKYEGQQFSILDPFNVQLGKKLWRFADLSEQCSMAWALWAE